MDETTRNLLLAEFESSWQQIYRLDSRRGIFFNYFNLAFFTVLTFTASVWIRDTAPTVLAAIALSATYGLLGVMAQAIYEALATKGHPLCST